MKTRFTGLYASLVIVRCSTVLLQKDSLARLILKVLEVLGFSIWSLNK